MLKGTKPEPLELVVEPPTEKPPLPSSGFKAGKTEIKDWGEGTATHPPHPATLVEKETRFKSLSKSGESESAVARAFELGSTGREVSKGAPLISSSEALKQPESAPSGNEPTVSSYSSSYAPHPYNGSGSGSSWGEPKAVTPAQSQPASTPNVDRLAAASARASEPPPLEGSGLSPSTVRVLKIAGIVLSVSISVGVLSYWILVSFVLPVC